MIMPCCFLLIIWPLIAGYEWLIGPGQALDTSKLFLVATELFGNGHSSSPSNTPEPFHGPRFPVMRIRDNVEAVHRLLTEELKNHSSPGYHRLFHGGAAGFSMVGKLSSIWPTVSSPLPAPPRRILMVWCGWKGRSRRSRPMRPSTTAITHRLLSKDWKRLLSSGQPGFIRRSGGGKSCGVPPRRPEPLLNRCLTGIVPILSRGRMPITLFYKCAPGSSMMLGQRQGSTAMWKKRFALSNFPFCICLLKPTSTSRLQMRHMKRVLSRVSCLNPSLLFGGIRQAPPAIRRMQNF